jgi:hypothetical protein
MGRNSRRTRKRDSQAARRNRGQGRAVPRPRPAASASLPTGNAVPVPREETLPERGSALPEDGQSGILRVPAQAPSWENDQDDCVQFSIITDVDGRKKTWSFSGVDRASKALCRPILSCGLVVAFIVVPIACVLALSSVRDRVICGLASAVVGGFVWIGARAKRRLKTWLQRRRHKASAVDAGRG